MQIRYKTKTQHCLPKDILFAFTDMKLPIKKKVVYYNPT